MDRSAHFEAFKTLITGPLDVYDTELPIVDGEVRRESYVVAYDMGPDGSPDDARYTAVQRHGSAVTLRYVTRAVGVTPYAARQVDEFIARKVVGAKLTVTGRRCEPIRLDDASELQSSRDVSPPLYFIESEFTLRSLPA